jgi:hypothetical protein
MTLGEIGLVFISIIIAVSLAGIPYALFTHFVVNKSIKAGTPMTPEGRLLPALFASILVPRDYSSLRGPHDQISTGSYGRRVRFDTQERWRNRPKSSYVLALSSPLLLSRSLLIHRTHQGQERCSCYSKLIRWWRRTAPRGKKYRYTVLRSQTDD